MSGRADQRWIVGCVVSLIAAVSSSVQAQAATGSASNGKPAKSAAMNDVDIARGHFRLGIDSYRDGDLATALIEFKRAYAASPNYRLLYNLGQVSQEQRDYPAAEVYYAQYLREGGAQIEAARKQEVEYELAKVRVRIASVAVTCNLAGVEVFVDDVFVGKTPLTEVVRVSTGQRRITGKRDGYAPATQVVDAAGGETVEVLLELLSPRVAANAELALSGPASSPSKHINPLALTLLIGTGALAIGTGVVAFLAEHDASEYRSALARKTTARELKSLSDGAKTKAAISDVLLGTTVIAAAASVIVIWQKGMTQRDSDSATLRLGPGGVELTGSF